MKNKELINLIYVRKHTIEEINTILPRKLVFPPTADIIENKPFDLLALREKVIAERIVLGKKNREIAQELGIAYETVKTHRKNIFRKLEVSNVQQLILKLQQ